MLALDAQVTDCNSALFDVAHDFHGCIAGCHEVLRRQGLLQGIWCLDPDEGLSPGQAAELDRVRADYPHLVDDHFVAEHRERWLAAAQAVMQLAVPRAFIVDSPSPDSYSFSN